ncbi:hypothetical protein Tco_0788249 [Tanacetum coccineum]
MADVNAPVEQAPAVAPPTRTNEQILPRIRWVPIGKSNCYLDAEKSQSNPIYKIAVDILKQTNFFRAFTASSTIPAIYIQQLWDTICYDRIAGGYKFQLDEKWFNLTKDTLRDALRITPAKSSSVTDSFGHHQSSSYRLCRKDVGRIHSIHPYFHGRQKEFGTTYSGKEESHSHCDPKCEVHQTNYLSSATQAQFHPRPESPLHFPTKEPIMGYLKFSTKGTKREVFGMPILNELITNDIRGADYYDAYLEKVAKHQRYLAGEEVSDPNSPALKPAKSTKPKLVDEFVDEGIPLTEPGFGDLEADTQRAIEESLKDAYGAPRGPLLPVVFRELDTGKFQPLPEVEGKGKEKVGHDESSSLYAELGLSDSDTESDGEVPPIVKSGAQEEGQAGPNPGKQDEDQAGPNPGNDIVSQPQSTPVVHAEPNLEHTNVEATDALSQPQPKQIDEGFTATVYPNVLENLKLTVDEPVIPKEPVSSTGTLSSIQHLAKDFSFGDQFFNDKPSEADNEKTTEDTKAELMVSVTIHQDISAIPPMISLVIDLNDWDTLLCPMFDEYFNPSPSVVQPVLVDAIQELVVSTAQSHVIPTSVEEDDHGIKVAHMDNDL